MKSMVSISSSSEMFSSLPLPIALSIQSLSAGLLLSSSTEKGLLRHWNHHRILDDHPNKFPLKSSSSSNSLFNMTPPLMAAALLVLSPLCDPPASFAQVHTQRGAFLFSKACIGCHYGGGNIIQPGATLFLKDLERNNIQTEEDIYKITYYGNGRMPGFGEKCTPRGQCTFGERLKDEDIKLLAQYVKSQAELGWENAEITSDGD